jgi:hypothetical protein
MYHVSSVIIKSDDNTHTRTHTHDRQPCSPSTTALTAKGKKLKTGSKTVKLVKSGIRAARSRRGQCQQHCVGGPNRQVHMCTEARYYFISHLQGIPNILTLMIFYCRKL